MIWQKKRTKQAAAACGGKELSESMTLSRVLKIFWVRRWESWKTKTNEHLMKTSKRTRNKVAYDLCSIITGFKVATQSEMGSAQKILRFTSPKKPANSPHSFPRSLNSPRVKVEVSRKNRKRFSLFDVVQREIFQTLLRFFSFGVYELIVVSVCPSAPAPSSLFLIRWKWIY